MSENCPSMAPMGLRPFRTTLTCSALAACFLVSGARADLVVDDFTSESMIAVYPGSSGGTVFLKTVLGEFRTLRVSTRNAASRTVMSASIDAGLLTGSITGTSNTELSPLYVDLGYYGSEATDLGGYAGLSFDFVLVQGAGELVALAGIGDTFLPPGLQRIPITAPGQLVIPLASMNLAPDASLDAISGLAFRFEASTETFAFTLDELRLIPEPSTQLLILPGGGIIAAFYWRRRCGPYVRPD